MKLLTHVVLVMILVASALIGGVFFASDYLLIQNLKNTEYNAVTESCNLVNHTIQREINTLGVIGRDWATWDDTYFFVQNRDQAYIDSNLVDETYINAGLDCFLILNSTGLPVYGRIFDHENQTAVQIPESFLTRIEESLGAQRSDTVEGIIVFPEGPMIVAAEPVLQSTGEGPAVGTLIMGRYIDDDLTGAISDITRMPVTILPAGDTSIYNGLSQNPGSEEGTPIIIAPSENGTIVSGIITIPDINGMPAFTTRIDLTRGLYLQGLEAVYSYIFIIIGICAAAGIVLIISLNRTLISPLEMMSGTVTAIRRDQDYSRRMRKGGVAEIETLSTSMNALFLSLQSSIEGQKEYEARLRESEEKYSTLFRSANDSIFIVRGDRFEDCNARALEVLGRTREEIVGAPIEILSPAYQPDGQRSADLIREYIRRAYAGESLSFSWEYQIADGTHRNAEITANRFDLGSGAYLLVIGRDITERLEMERLKNEAFGQIEQNLEQFAILNDEIRNPLQVIQAIVEMDSCKEAKSVLTQVEIINDLVNQLDRGYIESEKVREFLKKHYRIGEKK
ncbi:CHASE4 domain-containing protein [Methanofollis tationis]|uniref:PAS domain S-box protein n=1 Tax=Methanofollis tationis TaxID=81417 RepID=A0A7K4HMH0_9EURY|nr:CHASE4 domain-containing protein [Methanofollis tationis]NVO66078.1 PAS domain S-box protein [Methanofollis tationis]